MHFMESQRIVTARPRMARISQETLAIIGATIALAALILTSTAGVRSEIQVVRAESRADREAMRAEARADRQAFQEQILRLTEQQGVLGGQVEIIRNQIAAGG